MFRRALYQYYTNVNYRTCEKCLALQGRMRRRPDAFPQPDDGCESAILRIARKQVKEYRQQAKRMRLRAQAELKRRDLFERALQCLPDGTDEALELLRLAASIDLYIPDIERLAERHRDYFDDHPALKEKLRVQLRKAYSDKFGWRRYELLPEVMRLKREQAGMDRINELLR